MKKNNLEKKAQGSDQKKLAGIEKLHKTDREASLKGDFAILMTLLTDDCILLPPNREPISGKDAIQEYFQEQKKQLQGIKIIKYEHDFQEIRIFNNWAFEWGYFSSAARPTGGGDLIKGSGKLFRILKLQDDGLWKVARSIWNIDTKAE